jgi:hypothetical protein
MEENDSLKRSLAATKPAPLSTLLAFMHMENASLGQQKRRWPFEAVYRGCWYAIDISTKYGQLDH